MIDCPMTFPDRIAIRRKGTHHDSAGAIYIKVPAGAGPQVAAFLNAFAHLPGSVPPKLHPPREAFEAPPSRVETGGGSFSVEFYAHDWINAHPGPKGKEPQPSEHRAHVVATGDPRTKTASLTIRRDTDTSTWTELGLSEAMVTMTKSAYSRFAVLVTLQSTDSDGATAPFQRHLYPVLASRRSSARRPLISPRRSHPQPRARPRPPSPDHRTPRCRSTKARAAPAEAIHAVAGRVGHLGGHLQDRGSTP